MSTPLTKWAEKDGNKVKLYSRSNPHYYEDKNGNLHSIELTHSQSKSNSNISSFQLYEKNIHSVGIRTDNTTSKYLGIRPDDTQEDGTQQMEWSIENINVNGNIITPDLSTFETEGVLKKLGNVAVASNRKFTRQMVHYTGSINNFEIEYKLELKGLNISGSKNGDYHIPDRDNRFWILDEDDNLKYLISPPRLLDENLQKVSFYMSSSIHSSGSYTNVFQGHEQIYHPTTHTLKDNGDGTYEYKKYPSEKLLSASGSSITGSVKWIDAETLYSTAASDGYIYADSDTSAHGCLSASVGDVVDTNDHYYIIDYQNTKGIFGTTNNYVQRRGFLYFDASSIGTVSEATIYMTTTAQVSQGIFGTSGGITLKGTQSTTLSTADYNNIQNWSDTVVEVSDYPDGNPQYSGQIHGSSPADNTEYNVALNSTAITDINNDNYLKVVIHSLRGYSNTIAASWITGKLYYWWTEEEGTDKDPRLELIVTDDTGGTPSDGVVRLKLNSGLLKLSGGTLKIS